MSVSSGASTPCCMTGARSRDSATSVSCWFSISSDVTLLRGSYVACSIRRRLRCSKPLCLFIPPASRRGSPSESRVPLSRVSLFASLGRALRSSICVTPDDSYACEPLASKLLEVTFSNRNDYHLCYKSGECTAAALLILECLRVKSTA